MKGKYEKEKQKKTKKVKKVLDFPKKRDYNMYIR
jgi:hypothetical protein